jgi:hypothetical protein
MDPEQEAIGALGDPPGLEVVPLLQMLPEPLDRDRIVEPMLGPEFRDIVIG